MKEYPPAHTIHEARCPEAPAGLFSFRAGNLGQAYPNARPHHCFTRDTVRMNLPVVAEHIAYQAHPYEPSTLRPEDASKALCKICRGTHGSLVDESSRDRRAGHPAGT